MSFFFGDWQKTYTGACHVSPAPIFQMPACPPFPFFVNHEAFHAFALTPPDLSQNFPFSCPQMLLWQTNTRQHSNHKFKKSEYNPVRDHDTQNIIIQHLTKHTTTGKHIFSQAM